MALCISALPDRPESSARRHAVHHGLLEHWSSLMGHARRLAQNGSEAQDLVQETASRALEFAWSFEPGTNARAWLHQVLQSVFLSRARRLSRERRGLEAVFQDPCSWLRGEPQPAMLELSPPVRRALERLPHGFREVVRLVDVEERSYRDAASELGVPVGTIMSRLHRGRRLLAAALSDAAGASPRAA